MTTQTAKTNETLVGEPRIIAGQPREMSGQRRDTATAQKKGASKHLAIIIIRPNLAQSVVIGLIAGLVCQIPMLNATPLLNIPSEILGALACGLLIRIPLKIGKLDINPLVNTFISTCVSGFTFAALSVYINVVSVGGDFAVAMAAYVAIVLGTALFNCIFVQILAIPLKKVLKK